MAKTKVAPNPNVGPNIERLMAGRPELGSQPLLAKRTGLGQSTIGRILRSEVNTSAETLQKIASAFGVRLDVLYRDPKIPLEAGPEEWTPAPPVLALPEAIAVLADALNELNREQASAAAEALQTLARAPDSAKARDAVLSALQTR